MQETPETLLEETSELLEALAPIVQRGIDTLQHDPHPLLQHLIQQEIESQEDLLQRIEDMKERLQEHLNPPENVPQPEVATQPDESSDVDLHPDEITGGPSPIGVLPSGAVRRQPHPLTVTIPGRRLPISLRTGMATLIEVIKVLKIERVRSLDVMSSGIPLVAIEDYDGFQQTGVEGYYVAGNSSTETKALQIEEIGDILGIRLEVEQNNVM